MCRPVHSTDVVRSPRLLLFLLFLVAVAVPYLRKDKNKSHQVAVRSLAFKWLRITYRCWKDSEPYDEAVYMQSLRRRGSLLAGVLTTSTGVGWKSVAGFQRFSENNA